MSKKIKSSLLRGSQYRMGLIVILLPWCLVFILRNIGVINFQPLSVNFVVFLTAYILCGMLFYSIGYICFQKNNGKLVSNTPGGGTTTHRNMYFLFWCSIIYISTAYYSYLSAEASNLSVSSIIAMREFANIHGSRNSLIGFVQAFTSGAPPLLLTLLLSKCPPRRYGVAIYMVVLLGFSAMFLSGGRNAFFISILYVAVFNYFFLGKKLNFKKLSNILILILLLLAFIFSMYLFSARMVATGFDTDLGKHLELYYDVSIYKINSSNHVIQTIYGTFIYLVFYMTHSLNYASSYFALNHSLWLCGMYSLPDVARFFDVLFQTSFFDNAQNALLVKGVYLSFPGSTYIDFGWMGTMLITAVGGVMFGGLVRHLNGLGFVRRNIFSYVVVLILFAPVYSVYGMGNGFSILVMIIVLALINIKKQSLIRSNLYEEK